MTQFDRHPVRPSIPQRRTPLFAKILGGVVSLVMVVGGILWFVVRTEVNADRILVLVNKTGTTIPAYLTDDFGDQVILYDEFVDAIAERTGESKEQIRESYKV